MTEANLRDWLGPDGAPDPGDMFSIGPRAFTFIKCLGEGTFGKTFHVAPVGGAELVFKLFKSTNKAALAEIQKEFVRASQLQNTRCAKMKELLRENSEVIGFAYEYIEGQTIEQVISAHQKDSSISLPDSKTVGQLSLELFEILEELHRAKWVHKDIKPANLILLPDDRGINVIDFGLLTSVDSGTRAGWGTPEYMAPESAVSNKADTQFDLYAACASMLELLLGRQAFEACFTSNGIPRTFRFQGLAPADIAHLDRYGRNLARQLVKGLDVDPLNRPRTVSEVISLLLQVDDQSEVSGTEVLSEAVSGLLLQRKGSLGVLPPSDEFGKATQVEIRLLTELLPRVIDHHFDAVFLSGNPGDGKTTFLFELQEHLLGRGGVSENSTEKEWAIQFKGLRFHAILDASESDGPVSSDERIARVLGLLSQTGNVVLLAINDGRIDSFMRRYSDQFDFASDVQNQIRGLEPRNPRIRVVDLKKRSLIRTRLADDHGLGIQILQELTRPELWLTCESCVSREICPILDNKTRLRKQAAIEGVERLLSISHFRREQRATFRDVRSVFAYLITGDRSCKDVHEARRDGRDLRRASDMRFFDLAFAGDADDHLLRSWRTLDPARLPLAQAARRVSSRAIGDFEYLQQRSIASFAREAFFGLDEDLLGNLNSSEWSVYRYFDEYRDALLGHYYGLMPRVLRGLSRILGAPNPRSGKLSITMSDRLETWHVQRDFDMAAFNLEVRTSSGNEFVEEAADSLVLSYRGEIECNLLLDDFELILRADAGEVFNDVYSKEVIAKFGGLASRLRLRESDTLTILAPTNEEFIAVRQGTRIELRSA